MNNTRDLLFHTPATISFRRFGWPPMLPLNVVVSVSYGCNSRCATCNVWKAKSQETELSGEELDRIVQSLGQAPY